MNDIERALTRKFGPLPAWAWAAIFAGAMFLYRRSSMFTAAGGTPPTSATSPSVTDSTGTGGDPVTLDPGQSAYDPNTGQLVSAAPEQQPPNQTDPQAPVTLEPGETIYDPTTHQLLGGTPAGKSASTAKTKKAPKRKATRHTPKKKPQHGLHRAVKHHTNAKSKPRGSAKLQNPHTSPHKKTPAHGSTTPNITPKKTATRPVSTKQKTAIRSRVQAWGKGDKASPAATRRIRAAGLLSAPAMRQRPAAPRVVAEQRVTTHPARVSASPQRVPIIRAPAAAPRTAAAPRHAPPVSAPARKRK